MKTTPYWTRMSPTARNRRRRRLAALAGAFTAALAMTSLAAASFGSSSGATHTVQTKRIFPGSRVTGTRHISDASGGGTATVADDPLSYADAVVKATGNWANAFSTTRYLQVSFNNPLAAGVPVSGATFDSRIIPNAAGETACYYFEVRRRSDNSLLGTHFSSGTPQCVTGAAYSTISTSLSEVTSADIANDLYVQVFARESGAKPIKIDTATLTLSEFSTTETLFEEAYTNASTGTAATTTWSLDGADSAQYTSASNWATAFASTRSLQFAFPAYLPSGAVVTGATFTHSYKPATAGDTTCHYFEVYSSSTLLATHGSSATPVSCNSTSGFVIDAVLLPEVNTAARANTVVIKDYVRSSGAKKSIDDVDTLTVTYSLD